MPDPALAEFGERFLELSREIFGGRPTIRVCRRCRYGTVPTPTLYLYPSKTQTETLPPSSITFSQIQCILEHAPCSKFNVMGGFFTAL